MKAKLHRVGGGDPLALVNVAGVGVIQGSNQSEAARKAVRFLLSEQAQRHFADQTAEYPANPDVKPSKHKLPPITDLQAPDIDLSKLSSLQETRRSCCRKRGCPDARAPGRSRTHRALPRRRRGGPAAAGVPGGAFVRTRRRRRVGRAGADPDRGTGTAKPVARGGGDGRVPGAGSAQRVARRARRIWSGRRVFGVLLVLPLAVPSYVAGFTWISVVPDLTGFAGAFVVLTLVSYPYVLLPVAAALRTPIRRWRRSPARSAARVVRCSSR